MKLPAFLSPYVTGDSPVRLFQGLAVGIVGTLLYGFGSSGWNTSTTVQAKVDEATLSTMIAALAPICAERFETEAKTDTSLVDQINGVKRWGRDSHLVETGFATFPGGAEPNIKVAEECGILLTKSLKLE